MRILKNYILILCLACLLPFMGISQTQQNANAEGTKAEYLGKTSAVRDLVPLGPVSKQKKQQWKKENKIPRNFLGRGISKVTRPELEHQGKDKLRQGILAGTKSTDANVLVNVDGITAGSPNDPSGDIGQDHYMLAVNATTIAVYDKAGTEITTFTANTIWQEIGFSSAGDPIILYDEVEDRWLITEFPSGNQLLVAISETSDPTGAYDVYNFQTPNFPDYPKYGIWKDAITVTTNEQGTSNLTIYMINKSQLYGAKPQVDIQRMNLPGSAQTEAGFLVATPVDWMGKNAPVSDDPIFLAIEDSSWGEVDEDQIAVFTVDIDWFNPDNTTFAKSEIVTAPFDSYPCSVFSGGFSCVPQGGSNGGLDAIPEVIMNQAVYRNFGDYEAMVFNFITDVTDGDNLSGIRWVELRNSGSGWTLYQEGTFSPDDGLDRYMGGIAFDASGNIGLAYNVSSEEEFVGVRFTGRKHDDDLGMMTIPEQIVVDGSNSINSFARFGDYAQMGVDPINGKTFWYVTEYAGGPQESNTRILAFEIDRDANDVGVHKMISETSGAFDLNESITIQINNYGTEDASGFNVGYIFDGATPVIETFSGTIAAGTSAEYTFSQTIDFVGAGLYNFQSFTNYEADELVVNDSMWTQFNKLAEFDLGPAGLSLPNISCDTLIEGAVTIFNFGGEIITSATVEIFVDGELYNTINWEGNLEFCQSDVITFPLTNLDSGDHTVEVVVTNPNGEMDDNQMNNTIDGSFQVIADAIIATLTILTDDYPEETTWELVDANGVVAYSGGPYSNSNVEIEETFCLIEDACYTFTIFDSFGDGIFNPGTYDIVSEGGQPYASLMDNDFGTEESNDFCAMAGCFMQVEVTVTPAGDNGGTILLTPTSGIGPFMYSIDGGENFQDNGLFENLPEGTYDILINGAEDCTWEGEAEILACALQVVVNIDDVEGSAKGAILFEANGGNGPYEYSIDGGNTWQNNPLFNELEAGDYDIAVRDSDGCVYTDTITIKLSDGINNSTIGSILIATPNPTDGLFHIYLEGSTSGSTFINYEIFNGAGKAIRHATLVKYDDYYTTQVSLIHEPAGIYYIKVNDGVVNKMVKVIKL